MKRSRRHARIGRVACVDVNQGALMEVCRALNAQDTLGFSSGLSVEGRAYGIRVTTIIPGGMQTHFFDRFVEQSIPLLDPENLQSPATVAEAIVFVARVPARSALQELMIAPMNETSWP